jgi:hypothetical protein
MAVDEELASDAYSAVERLFRWSVGATSSAPTEKMRDEPTALDSLALSVALSYVLRERSQELKLDHLYDALNAVDDIAALRGAESAPDEVRTRLSVTWYSTLRLSPDEADLVRTWLDESSIEADTVHRVKAWIGRP